MGRSLPMGRNAKQRPRSRPRLGRNLRTRRMSVAKVLCPRHCPTQPTVHRGRGPEVGCLAPSVLRAHQAGCGGTFGSPGLGGFGCFLGVGFGLSTYLTGVGMNFILISWKLWAGHGSFVQIHFQYKTFSIEKNNIGDTCLIPMVYCHGSATRTSFGPIAQKNGRIPTSLPRTFWRRRTQQPPLT